MMPEAERQQFRKEMLQGHKQTQENRSILLRARRDEHEQENHKDACSDEQSSCPNDPRLETGSFLGKDWEIGRCLGSGSYGKVVEVREECSGVVLAAKVAVREDTLQDLDAERRILERLTHPNIIKAFGFIASRSNAALLLELAQTDLLTWLKGPPSFEVLDTSCSSGLRRRWEMLYQLVSAVRFLHENKILHLDIKTNNVLVVDSQSRTPVVKLADFGLSQTVTDDKLVVFAKGAFTLNFRAPELLFADGSRVEISYPSDVYAVGCCAYDIFKVSCASQLLFPTKELFKYLDELHSKRGREAATTALTKHRDERLLGDNTKNVARVQDAMAIQAIKETVAPLARRVSLPHIKALVHHRATKFEKQAGARGST